jgi:hypothetical protein
VVSVPIIRPILQREFFLAQKKIAACGSSYTDPYSNRDIALKSNPV